MFCSLLYCTFVYFAYLLIVPHSTVFITYGSFECMHICTFSTFSSLPREFVPRDNFPYFVVRSLDALSVVNKVGYDTYRWSTPARQWKALPFHL